MLRHRVPKRRLCRATQSPCQSIRCRFSSAVCFAKAPRRNAGLFHSDPVLCRSSAPHSQSHAPPIIAVAPQINAVAFRFVSNQSIERRFFATPSRINAMPFLIAARRFFAAALPLIAVNAVAFSADPCSSTPQPSRSSPCGSIASFRRSLASRSEALALLSMPFLIIASRCRRIALSAILCHCQSGRSISFATQREASADPRQRYPCCS